MSHNKIKINSQEPNIDGTITVALDSLSDVTTSGASTGDVLKKDASGWVSGPAAAAAAEDVLIGQGGSDSYSNSSATSIRLTGDYVELYDTSPLNTLGATLISSSNWISGITLAAGEYLIQCTVRPSFSASGYCAFHLGDKSTTTILSNSAIVGDNAYLYGSALPSTLQGYMSLSATTTVGIKVLSGSNINTVGNQGTQLSTDSFLLIIKV